MLNNTTIIIQVHKDYKNTIDQALNFCNNVIVFDDASTGLDFSKYKDKVQVIRLETFSGRYEDCLNICIPNIKTKYIVKVNGGDEILQLEEPQEGMDILLANCGKSMPNHNLDRNYYVNIGGTSFISGSTIPTDYYKELLLQYPSTIFTNFDSYCLDKILNSPAKFYQYLTQSYDFTYNMWGGKMAAFTLANPNQKTNRKTSGGASQTSTGPKVTVTVTKN